MAKIYLSFVNKPLYTSKAFRGPPFVFINIGIALFREEPTIAIPSFFSQLAFSLHY